MTVVIAAGLASSVRWLKRSRSHEQDVYYKLGGSGILTLSLPGLALMRGVTIFLRPHYM